LGRYYDIWVRVNEFEEKKKAVRKKAREEKEQELEARLCEGASIPEAKDNEALEMEQIETASTLSSIDYRVIREYKLPPFTPGEPNLTQPGALQKYKNRFSKYLAFIDSVKYFRSSKYCSIIAIATTSNVLLNIWSSEKNISNALKELKAIGLIKDYNDYYQTGMCKQYCYFVENEALLIEHCKAYGIQKPVTQNQQKLTPKQAKEYQARCEEVYSEQFRKSVLFKSRLNLKRPDGVKPSQFIKDLYEMLYENYPGLRIYQQIAETINEIYYKDLSEFQIKFSPTFHWNENPKKEKAKRQAAIVGIGIRVSNKLCSAKKDNDSTDGETKKVLRADILSKYGFTFEKDITSSVPRVAYALNHGGWLKEDVDLYEKIYLEVNPNGTDEDFQLEREAIKKLFFRVYFDTTDNKLAFHTWNSMVQDGADKDAVYKDMINLRRAMETVLGRVRYDNYIFYVESCIYIDTLHSLLEAGYQVWLVYDCFYGSGFGSQEEFERLVLEAVWTSFVRFKTACDFNKWDEIFALGN
jgi:hypothetical protein